MERIAEFIKSILAGIMISIGALAYLYCENKAVGAFLFSTGLICVCMFGFNLYTGRIGYVLNNDRIYLLDTLLSILGNFLGCLIIALIKSPAGRVAEVCSAKLDKSYGALLADAVLCGVLIYAAVEIYKKKNTVVGILVCIPTFILCGFEHSVADMFYFLNGGIFTPKAAAAVGVVIVGNAVGGLAIPVMMMLAEKQKSGEQARTK